jgi:small subunit ribosomal protein S9
MPKTKKPNYIYAVGRRKSASARIRLFKGKGESTVNGIAFEKYFPGDIFNSFWTKPFDLTDTKEKYYVTVNVRGGGKNGQLEAASLGISRALSLADKDKFRFSLKKAGLLSRDSRIRERRKVGMGGKARRKKQSPKR